ncbi:hypothetical protein COU74_05390 [Candidatus Peregrinibacteria bacterium CG10_big_fil_rev_8_21_14_0_10_36_19]|nr:MAG: hypothetical protein COU74_05390 [Candidatus Peregrinibacteria bacterium CG10_big_fil_rev_8_21_14_0_10_36_19]
MFNNPIGTWTLFKRETNRFMKVYMQTIIAPVISNLLFLTVFGLSLSRGSEMIHGLSYLQFIVPGLVMMGMTNNAYQNPSSSIIITKYQGRIDELMTIPLTPGEILTGFIASATLRGFIVGIATLIPAAFFVDVTPFSLPITLLSALLLNLCFSFLGFVVGVWADEFDKTAFLQNFILMPLTFLGGVFYSTSSLPSPFSYISNFNPIVYMVNTLRYGFTGYAEYSITLSFALISGITLALGIASYVIIRSGWKLKN